MKSLLRSVPLSHFCLLGLVLLVFGWSGWRPHDRLTWWLETAPTIAGVLLLLATYRRFTFTTFTYFFIALHMVLLCIGGHHTYAREPFFGWLQTEFDLARNHFDRLGHFVQGFVPALVARELFLRLGVLQRERWQPFLIVCICAAISAVYELIEWAAAELSGSAAVEFLATQGDVWDTQKDMGLAIIGAVSALALLARWQDRALRRRREVEP